MNGVKHEAVNMIVGCFIMEFLVFKNHLSVHLSLLLTADCNWAYERWSQ